MVSGVRAIVLREFQSSDRTRPPRPAAIAADLQSYATGTGNANPYHSPTSWATTTNFTQSSTGSTKEEIITITGPTNGTRYIILNAVASFSGVTVGTEY